MNIILNYIAECDFRSEGQLVSLVHEKNGLQYPVVTPTPIMQAMFEVRPIRPRHIG